MMRCLAILFLLVARVTTAQIPGTTVSGVTYDSVAGAPLSGAIVQIASAEFAANADRSTISDSLGRFTLAGLPDGRFTIGFFHPSLDVLGIDAPTREIRVVDRQPVRVDLAIPAARRIRAAICGLAQSPDSGALLVGVIRDAMGDIPMNGATVRGEWYEFSLTDEGLTRHPRYRTAMTAESGWFAMCGVPRDGTIAVIASRGVDSTERTEVTIPAEGLARTELFLGSSRTVMVGDPSHRGDTLSLPPVRIFVGNARLTGSVITSDGAKPVGGAQVGITNGPQTRANDSGQWTIVDAPPGTRTLEVRALGFYPEQRRVDVVGTNPPISVALATLKSVLDTVRISAGRRVYDRVTYEFDQRRRSGVGGYLTQENIARFGGFETTGLFRLMRGVQVRRDSRTGETNLVMRGANASWCRPAIYIDGHNIPGIGGSEINNWVRPDQVVGIEVYPHLAAPMRYQKPLSGCGTILIWTKR